MNSIDQYDFYLPEELIAQSPADKRDHSRLLAVNLENNTYEDKHFYDIINYLKPGDVLVRNNTKVIPARLFGVKEQTHAHIELLLLKEIDKDTWECLVGNAKAVKVGTRVDFGEGKLIAECINVLDEGLRHFKFIYQGIFFEVLDELGKMPLPPYIHEQVSDNSRYQTVYAKVEGSAAAPTAGFHFTEEIFAKLQQMGVIICDVMHSEFYMMSQETADILNKAKKEGRRIIAIGTTSTRTLESVMQKYGEFKECSGDTNIFIFPGYKFLAIDALITNFHLPKSTLIMLVSAFAGREFTLEFYKHAVNEKYRFFSFGDAMFITD